MSDRTRIDFTELRDSHSADFRKAMAIYKEAFPKRERHPVKTVKERLNNGLYKFFIGKIREKIVFTCWLFPVPDTAFLLFDYMAVAKKSRGTGIGSSFLKYLKEYLAENPQFEYVLFEVEDPETGDNKTERIQRFNFYKKNGIKRVGQIKYILPPLSGSKELTEMILMLTSSRDIKSIAADELSKAIYKIYRMLYSRGEMDSYLLPFKNTIQQQNILN